MRMSCEWAQRVRAPSAWPECIERAPRVCAMRLRTTRVWDEAGLDSLALRVCSATAEYTGAPCDTMPPPAAASGVPGGLRNEAQPQLTSLHAGRGESWRWRLRPPYSPAPEDGRSELGLGRVGVSCLWPTSIEEAPRGRRGSRPELQRGAARRYGRVPPCPAEHGFGADSRSRIVRDHKIRRAA